MLKKLGLGQKTGIGLPGESAGSVPPRSQWSGSTFGNLPIGQGLSMTVLQMAGHVPGDRERRRARRRRGSSRRRSEAGRDAGARAPRPQGGARGQAADGEDGAGHDARGHAERRRRRTGAPRHGGAARLPDLRQDRHRPAGRPAAPAAYSDSTVRITFAGILPADNPRFVVGIVLDAPSTRAAGGALRGAAVPRRSPRTWRSGTRSRCPRPKPRSRPCSCRTEVGTARDKPPRPSRPGLRSPQVASAPEASLAPSRGRHARRAHEPRLRAISTTA